MPTPAVFLDKDGTLIEDVPYNVDPAKIVMAEGAMESLKRLAPYFVFIIITNQSGMARGYFEENDLMGVKRFMEGQFASHGMRLSGFYFCPHHPDGTVEKYRKDCECRKPGPGMLYQAQKDHDLDLARSWFIGDILNDVECAKRAGCKAILLDNGNETEWTPGPLRTPDAIVKNFYDAVKFIYDRMDQGQKDTVHKAG